MFVEYQPFTPSKPRLFKPGARGVDILISVCLVVHVVGRAKRAPLCVRAGQFQTCTGPIGGSRFGGPARVRENRHTFPDRTHTRSPMLLGGKKKKKSSRALSYECLAFSRTRRWAGAPGDSFICVGLGAAATRTINYPPGRHAIFASPLLRTLLENPRIVANDLLLCGETFPLVLPFLDVRGSPQALGNHVAGAIFFETTAAIRI